MKTKKTFFSKEMNERQALPSKVNKYDKTFAKALKYRRKKIAKIYLLNMSLNNCLKHFIFYMNKYGYNDYLQ